MPRIKDRMPAALFAIKPRTRDRKKRQTRFVFEPKPHARFGGIVHPDQAKAMIAEGMATAADFGFDEANFDTTFNPEELQ